LFFNRQKLKINSNHLSVSKHVVGISTGSDDYKTISLRFLELETSPHSTDCLMMSACFLT